MNLGKTVQFAEIISSMAVLVTLLFLISEISENTAVTRSEAYGESVDRLNYWRMELANNPDLTQIFMTFSQGNFDQLSEVESQQFSFLNGALWGIYEASYYARNYNTLGEEEWLRFRNQICFQYNLSDSQDAWNSISARFSVEFRNYVIAECGT